MKKDERKNALLSALIKDYIKTAQPVGSNLLVDKCKLKISSATVRNEMAELEKEGLIMQPHTSAGRIPTEKGYRYYLDNFFEEKQIISKEKKVLEQIEGEQEERIKKMAKVLTELSPAAVLVGFADNNFYYTGLSNLFREPEFDLDLIYNISEVVDQIDEVMAEIYDKVTPDIKIWMGQENPFSENCAVVISKFEKHGIIGLLGPMRMDYESNFARLKYLKELI